MKLAYSPVMLVLTSVALLLFTVPALSEIKCWKNDESVYECGRVVPPEYVQKEHVILSEQGIEIEKKQRAKTEEELAKLREEKRREQQKKQSREEQKRHDQVLIDVFNNVEEIEIARDQRIEALDNSIELAKSRTEILQKNLDGLLQRIADQEHAGKTPSERLLGRVNSLKRQIKNNEGSVRKKLMEKEKINETFAKDIIRYKELKGLE